MSEQVYSDSQLFRFWITEAQERPGAMANLLAGCLYIDDYVVAISAAMKARGIKPQADQDLKLRDFICICCGEEYDAIESLRHWESNHQAKREWIEKNKV